MRFTATRSVFATLSGLTALIAVGVTAAQTTTPPPPPPPFSGTPVLTTPTPAAYVKLPASLPTLSKSQQKRILSIMRSNKQLKKLLKKKPYKVAAVIVWTNPVGQKLGGVVSVQFTQPHTLSGSWKEISFGCGAATTATYKQVTYTAKYTRVVQLTVSVDLSKKKVVGLVPLGSLVGTIRYPNPQDVPVVCHS